MITSHQALAASAWACTIALAAPAHAHFHMTVDTLYGAAGDPIRIRAGYLATEGALTIADGRLLYNGSIATFTVGERLAQPGPLDGAWYSQDLLLTSDFYFATGRLAGGNFRWEIASVAVLSGTAGTVGWGEFDHDGMFAGMASNSAGSRIGRSYDTLAGYHEHEQAAYFTAVGTYDVTVIAWDSNGRYADSAPVTIRFAVVPAPGAIAAIAIVGACGMRRRRS
jgi:hypothetical protein